MALVVHVARCVESAHPEYQTSHVSYLPHALKPHRWACGIEAGLCRQHSILLADGQLSGT